MADNNITTIANMQIVPHKFSQYVIDRQLDKNVLIKSGIAVTDSRVRQLINGTPEGGRFIDLPMYNPLDGDADVFGEEAVSVEGITTKKATATLLIRQKAWGNTDLAHVLGGDDPMQAIINLIADWRNTQEQKVYLAILKAILDNTNGCLKDHVNDLTSGTTTAITNEAVIDTRSVLGDNFGILGMVVMHSMTYNYLIKNNMVERLPITDPFAPTIEFERYLGYRIMIDDSMPFISYETTTSGTSGAIAVTTDNIKDIQPHCATTLEAGTSYVKKMAKPVYDTYILGQGAFIREEGTPVGLVTTETDRDKFESKNYIINRWCNVIHPNGLSWVSNGVYTNPLNQYPANVDLAIPTNWGLTVNHRKVPIVALRHTL